MAVINTGMVPKALAGGAPRPQPKRPKKTKPKVPRVPRTQSEPRKT